VRRTRRLAERQHHVGLALGGAAGSRLAQRLGLPVSGSTLLRLVRHGASCRTTPELRVIGIDDWAWKRGHRHGSIICDLERRRIVDLLRDRASATVEEWLAAHPGIEVIARDRGGAYGPAATRACPGATQVADRWHLIENASAALLDAVRRSMRRIRAAFGAATVAPALLTAAGRRQHDGFLCREAANAIIRRLAAVGTPIKEIVRQTGHSRKVVCEVVRGSRTDMFRARVSSLDAFLPHLEAEWTGGCRNGAELWRRLKAAGFRSALRVVSEWATRRRRSQNAAGLLLRKPPSARTIARLMTSKRDRLSTAEATVVATVEHVVPPLRVARDLVERLHTMLRSKTIAGLDAWLTDAAPVFSGDSPVVSPQIAPPSKPLSPNRGPTARPKIEQCRLEANSQIFRRLVCPGSAAVFCCATRAGRRAKTALGRLVSDIGSWRQIWKGGAAGLPLYLIGYNDTG
jgi:transposase